MTAAANPPAAPHAGRPEPVPVGLYGWLLELPGGLGAASLSRYLLGLRAAGDLPASAEVVAGARTVLVDGPPQAPVPRADLERLLAGWAGPAGMPAEPAELVEIPVRYDGPDLDGVAELAGLTPADVAAAHAEPEYVVAFCGFSAGFGYLTGVPERLQVPRLSRPRTAVPAGSVALAAEYTGVYPRRSPGGWRLIGRTDAVVWDTRRDPPSRLLPGTRVRFVPVG